MHSQSQTPSLLLWMPSPLQSIISTVDTTTEEILSEYSSGEHKWSLNVGPMNRGFPAACLFQTQGLFSVPFWRLPFCCFHPGLDQAAFPKSLGEGDSSFLHPGLLSFALRSATPSTSFPTNSMILLPGGWSHEILEESVLGSEPGEPPWTAARTGFSASHWAFLSSFSFILSCF